MLLHLKLLTQMVGHFYDAKRREQAQRQNAYTQAIYETGARLTHDVKNLLQSLRSLCAAVDTSDADQAGALQALMQRQLPDPQRLNGRSPSSGPHQVDPRGDRRVVGALVRHGARNVSPVAAHQDVKLPEEMFESGADNSSRTRQQGGKFDRPEGPGDVSPARGASNLAQRAQAEARRRAALECRRSSTARRGLYTGQAADRSATAWRRGETTGERVLVLTRQPRLAAVMDWKLEMDFQTSAVQSLVSLVPA